MTVSADWLYIIASIAGAEVLYLGIRYQYSGPRFRQEVWEWVWSYVLAWVAVIGVLGAYQGAPVMSRVIAQGLGLQALQPSLGTIEGYMECTGMSWALWYAVVTAMRAIGSVEVAGLRLGIFSALASYLSTMTSLQWDAYEGFVIDLSILYVLTVFWTYMNRYGIWIITTSLLIPRSTRGLGATFTAYYLVLTVMLPVMYGILNAELPYVQVIPYCQGAGLCDPLQYLRSVPDLVNPTVWGEVGQCLLRDLGAVGLQGLGNAMGMSPVSAFHAFTWDLWLALSYAITFAIALYLARLIDAGAFRLLEAIT